MAAEAASMTGLRRSRNFLMELALRKAPKPPIKRLTRWRVARGDTVELIANPVVSKDVGKQGKVLRVDRKKNRLYVEGIALRKKAVRPEPGKEGGMVPIEGAIHYSNVALVDPTTGQGAKVRYRKTENGVAVRVAVKSGAIIPRSDESKLRKKPRPVAPGPSDTPSELALKETWEGMETEIERAVRRRQQRRQRMMDARQPAQYKGSLPPRTRRRAPFASQPPVPEASDERV